MSDRATFSIPSWAVPAIGEAHLEPVCRSKDNYTAISLTHQPVYYIGRACSNDILLNHLNASRIHALIFHHPSGVCYLVDCCSKQGTFVNGRRIRSLSPFRIKRGNLVRFGDNGAPAFILKSFSSKFDRVVTDLSGVANAFRGKGPKSKEVAMLVHGVKTNGIVCIRGADRGMACITDEDDAPAAALVLLNTRLNACGGQGLAQTRVDKNAKKAGCFRIGGCKRLRTSWICDYPAKKIRTRSKAFHSPSSSFLQADSDSSPELNARRKWEGFRNDRPTSLLPPSDSPLESSSRFECRSDGNNDVRRLRVVNRVRFSSVDNFKLQA